MLRLAGNYTLAEFCRRIDELDLFGVAPQRGDVSRLYRRWTFHSAALDLALRQAARPLYDVLGREPSPLTFVVSLRLGEPPSLAPIHSRLEHYPTLRFKLDATSSWTPELIARLVATGAVDSIDFKALYHGTIVDQEPDPVLYRRVVRGVPGRLARGPRRRARRDRRRAGGRLTTGSPGTPRSTRSTTSRRCPFAPRMVNIKPSRIGGLAKLCDTYDYCAEQGIGAYGGGQFELGPGRGQAQYLASLFHPDTPNDLAPVGFNRVRAGDPVCPAARYRWPPTTSAFAGTPPEIRAWCAAPPQLRSSSSFPWTPRSLMRVKASLTWSSASTESMRTRNEPSARAPKACSRPGRRSSRVSWMPP